MGEDATEDEGEGVIEWTGRLTMTLVMCGFIAHALLLKWVAGVLGIPMPRGNPAKKS